MAYTRSWKKPYVKPEAAKKARLIRDWSDLQKVIFQDIASGEGNTQVDALAGTGKTSTITEGFYHLPANNSTLMVAFNKDIQLELESRAPQGVTVLTLHSLGFRAAKRAFPNIQLDKNKLDGYIVAERGSEPETADVRYSLAKAVSLAKGYLAHTPEAIDPILDKHDIDLDGEKRETFIATVIKVLEATKRDTMRMDFDDMVWMPVVHGLRLEKYGNVFIDEAQDLNQAQHELALNSLRDDGRVISVGDEHQAIYGFRGADSNSIQTIVDRMHSKRLPLSVTYRCARNIVEYARQWVPEYQAGPNAPDGLVEYMNANRLEDMAQKGDFILSRVNAPLLKWCMALLKVGKPANIQGRDVGKGLAAWVKKSKAKNVNDFLDWLHDFQNMEVERLNKAKRDPAVVNDKVECLETLCQGTNNLREVLVNIDKLFHDGNETDRIILSSTHKAKGLERDRVFMLVDTYRPGTDKEETNLAYVAATRAKNELYLVEGGRKK